MPKRAKKNINQQYRCPYCGALMEIRPAAEIYHDAANHQKMLVCRNYPSCDTYVRVQQGTNLPLGTPANGNLRYLRHCAHKSFDSLWNQGFMSRDAAYRWMSDFLGVRMQDAHIGKFGTYQCQTVIAKCDELSRHRKEMVG